MFLRKAAVLANVVAQIAPTHYIYYKVQVVSVFECIMHVHQKPTFLTVTHLRVGQLRQELFFVHDGINGALGDNPRLGHLLHSEELSLLSLFYFPNLAKATAANHVLEVKVVFVNSYTHLG